MDQNNKIPIRIAEISINKFNDQIHQKVIQLQRFRVAKTASALSDLEKLRKEAINSLRVVRQLKQLLIELDHLKSRTKPEDHGKFDELTSKRKNEALKEIKMYQGQLIISHISEVSIPIITYILDMKPIEKLNELSPSASIEYESSSTVQINSDLMNVQLCVDESEIRRRELETKQAL